MREVVVNTCMLERKGEPETLQKLQLNDSGEFVDSNHNVQSVVVLGLGVHTCSNQRPILEKLKIPEGANAYIEGDSFDNGDEGSSYRYAPQIVAPVLYLRIV